jgi:chaperone required for assembly of F1-ATPase
MRGHAQDPSERRPLSARETPKRFYKNASARADGDSFIVLLVARTLKTPRGAAFHVPTLGLAEACAAEWAAQGERILPGQMPLTQLAFAAIDYPRRDESIAYIAKYAETDLTCHRASTPAGLALRHAQAWDPLLAWASDILNLRLPVVEGVIAADIEATALRRVHELASGLDNFRLIALTQATGLSGSVIIAFALLRGRLSAAEAFAASTVDEAWSTENWGEDWEARARLDRMRGEFDALARFIAALA